ncbi:DNA/RNA-binding protein KIN17 [Morella rubra]|uniref:DNA/RNA-binding protein KIN17 n=1 Tax=Morella rubra TaxID=262757 RepID=A0A6A1W185_9ROSI|nr:DNA/RNA-binding protein KIN17 [Morella rubra]
MSESHQRQMLIFGQNPNRFVEGYSEEFEHSFLEHMKRSHRFSRVAATVVYNVCINDRDHIHMNSTEWASYHKTGQAMYTLRLPETPDNRLSIR